MTSIFEHFTRRRGSPSSSFRYLLDGERVDSVNTLKMLELDDNDHLDCMYEQVAC
jgi:hypothetical protein